MVALQVIVTSYLTVSILVGSPEHRSRDQCLGNYMIHYTRYFFFFQFKFYDISMSHTTTEEKCGMGFSQSSGEKKIPYESRVAEPQVTSREIYHATFLLSGGVP